MLIMYVLDEKNTVMEVIGDLIDRESCFDQLKAVDKIIKKGHRLTISGIGSIKEPRKIENEVYTHPDLGTFHTNGHSLGFMAIQNEKGMCYSAYRGKEKPCPDAPFPIKAHP